MAQRLNNVIVSPADRIVDVYRLCQDDSTAHDCAMIIYGEPQYFPIVLAAAKLTGFLFCGDLCSDILSPAIWDISTDAFDLIKRSSCFVLKRGRPSHYVPVLNAAIKVFCDQYDLSRHELAQIEGPISRYLQEVFPGA